MVFCSPCQDATASGSKFITPSRLFHAENLHGVHVEPHNLDHIRGPADCPSPNSRPQDTPSPAHNLASLTRSSGYGCAPPERPASRLLPLSPARRLLAACWPCDHRRPLLALARRTGSTACSTCQRVSLHRDYRRAACKPLTASSLCSGGSGSTRRHGRASRALWSIDPRVLVFLCPYPNRTCFSRNSSP